METDRDIEEDKPDEIKVQVEKKLSQASDRAGLSTTGNEASHNGTEHSTTTIVLSSNEGEEGFSQAVDHSSNKSPASSSGIETFLDNTLRKPEATTKSGKKLSSVNGRSRVQSTTKIATKSQSNSKNGVPKAQKTQVSSFDQQSTTLKPCFVVTKVEG